MTIGSHPICCPRCGAGLDIGALQQAHMWKVLGSPVAGVGLTLPVLPRPPESTTVTPWFSLSDPPVRDGVYEIGGVDDLITSTTGYWSFFGEGRWRGVWRSPAEADAKRKSPFTWLNHLNEPQGMWRGLLGFASNAGLVHISYGATPGLAFDNWPAFDEVELRK